MMSAGRPKKRRVSMFASNVPAKDVLAVAAGHLAVDAPAPPRSGLSWRCPMAFNDSKTGVCALKHAARCGGP